MSQQVASLPEREGDAQDFVFQLLFKYSDEEVKEAYLGMLPFIHRNVPQISEETMALAKKITEPDAQKLMMLMELVRDHKNDLVQFATAHAHPLSRLDYFRAVFKDLSSKYVTVQLTATRVPNPEIPMSITRADYWRRLDDGKRFRQHHHEYVPPDDGLQLGR